MKTKDGETISSPWSRKRDDFNPHPELPMLLVVPTQRVAERLQRILNPNEIHVAAIGSALMGYRFRMILLAVDGYLRSIYENKEAWGSFLRWRHEELPLKLAAGCEQYIIDL